MFVLCCYHFPLSLSIYFTQQIANFNVEDALKDLDFEPELLNDDAKADITNSKTSLDDYDFAAMKTTVADTG